MRSTAQSGKSSQLLVIVVAGLLLLLIVFGLSKLIPRGAIPTQIKPSPLPSVAPAKEGSPTSANTYTNSDYGFSLTLPDNWEAKENIAVSLPARLFFIGFGPANSTDVLATIEVKDQPIDEVITNFRTEVNQLPDTKIALEREVRLGKQYVKQINVTNTTTTYYRFAPQGNRSYILSGQDPKLLDSFTFTNSSTRP